jgi:hypothetical protein
LRVHAGCTGLIPSLTSSFESAKLRAL